MARLKSEIEVSLILRDAKLKRDAKAVLAAPAYPGTIHFLGMFSAIVVSSIALNEVKPGPIMAGLLTGALTGFVAVSIELWSVRRRLDAVIQLLSLGESLNDQGPHCGSKEGNSVDASPSTNENHA